MSIVMFLGVANFFVDHWHWYVLQILLKAYSLKKKNPGKRMRLNEVKVNKSATLISKLDFLEKNWLFYTNDSWYWYMLQILLKAYSLKKKKIRENE